MAAIVENGSILVTGGAGYIGSAAVDVLREGGNEVVVLDNLSTGHEGAARRALGESFAENFYRGDISDPELVTNIVQKHGVVAVVHFAAKSLVSESVQYPELYALENTMKTGRMLRALIDAGVDKVVFSSTAAVYGDRGNGPITETATTRPINPYGESKLNIEAILTALADEGLNAISLRYFNVAGAIHSEMGEGHNPETHLIPNLIKAAIKDQKASVYGDDYETHDGSCVRDYIHISDLVEAHLLALRRLLDQEVRKELRGSRHEVFNLGTQSGSSVLEVVEAIRKFRDLEVEIKPRRPGDPAFLIADASKATRVLGWTPTRSIRDSVSTAFEWHSKNPEGYVRADE
jgi:UDP-glucose 4-epimerase